MWWSVLMPLSVAPFEEAGLNVQLDEFEALVMDAVARTLPRRPLRSSPSSRSSNSCSSKSQPASKPWPAAGTAGQGRASLWKSRRQAPTAPLPTLKR